MNACLGSFSADLLAQLMDRTPFLWLNPSLGQPLPSGAPTASDIDATADRMKRCRPLLVSLFPEINTSGGNIESPLLRAAELQSHRGAATGGPWFIKADHALPVAGSIKARGGFHEILALAEELACANGVVSHGYEALKLVSAEARAVFAQHTVSVGSTGNLGLSIGVMAAALGFRTVVYMSSDAKEWKKARLRDRGVIVIEAPGDYAAAVAEGRAASTADPRGYFVDDERSLRLFLGYAAAARPFADQLVAAGRRVDADHPLFVYLPCGVGGAPGGVTFGLKAIFGKNVHCFFAEPVASPCMLVQLASGIDEPVSVYDIGLDNCTEADGLAVGLASTLASPLMASHLAGIFTVTDSQLFKDLHLASLHESIELEPSAAAAIGGPSWLTESDAGRAYLRRQDLDHRMDQATHVIWTTGGSLTPPAERAKFKLLGEQAAIADCVREPAVGAGLQR